MDIKLILGPNNSGKSLFAENLAVNTAASVRIYLATMIPQNEENDCRIEKHKKQRHGKGFFTIEEPWDIHLQDIPEDSVVLLEDASNLLANGIFLHRADTEETYKRILSLAEKCKTLIIVNIDGLEVGDYDEETNDYIRQMDRLNRMLEKISSECINFS